MVISLFEVYFLVIEHSFVKEEFKHQKAPKNFPSSSWESNSRPSESRGEFKWNESSRWKFSGKKVIPFEVFTFYRNDRNFLFHFFVWITSARLHVERKRKIYRYFVNGTTQSRSCFRCQKKYQYHLTEIFHRNFRTNGKRSRMFNHLYMSQRRQHIILIYFRPVCVGPTGVSKEQKRFSDSKSIRKKKKLAEEEREKQHGIPDCNQ